jgi:hypothetical protein
VQPRHPDPVAERECIAAPAERVDAADHLMAGHDREVWEVEITLDHVQVGAAAATRAHPYAHLTRAGHRVWELDELERSCSDRRR